MSTYYWKHYEISFTRDEEMYFILAKRFIDAISDMSNKFDKRYKEIKGLDDQALTDVGVAAIDILYEEWDILQGFIHQDRIYINPQSLNKIWEQVELDIIESMYSMNAVAQKHYFGYRSMREQQQEELRFKREQRMRSNQWVGFGRGMTGAVKAAAQAKVMNLATNTAYSAAGAIGDLSRKVQDNQKVKKVKQYLKENYEDMMLLSIWCAFQGVTDYLKISTVLPEEIGKEHKRILDTYKNDDSIEAERKLFLNIKTFPCDDEQYEILIRKYGDENRELRELAETFLVDIDEIKKKILAEEYKKLPDSKDLKVLANQYVQMENRRKQIGYWGNRQEYEFNLLKSIKNATDCILKAESNDPKETINTLQLVVKDVYQSEASGLEWIRKIQNKIQELDLQARTIGDKVFNSIEEAEQNRPLYVGGVWYSTIEEAKEAEQKIEERKKKLVEEEERKRILEQSYYKEGESMATASLVLTLLSMFVLSVKPSFVYYLEIPCILLALYSKSRVKKKRSTAAIVLAVLLILSFGTDAFDEEEYQKEFEEYMTGETDTAPTLTANNRVEESVEKGDAAEYFFYDSDSRELTDAEINSLSKNERIYAAFEIFARHGVRFNNLNDRGLLNKYFSQRSWYQPTVDYDDFDPLELNNIELSNYRKLIAASQETEQEYNLNDTDVAENTKIDTEESINSADSYIFPDSDSRYLTDDDLAGMDAATLRLARNEIYARHGRKFQTEDLNQYFSQKTWYAGYLSDSEFDDSVFNEYEKENLIYIQQMEAMRQ